MNPWCVVCGVDMRTRCSHCPFCTRTEGHEPFCPEELRTYPSPTEDLLCMRCEQATPTFRLVLIEERDAEDDEVWEVCCPTCAAAIEESP